MPSANPQPDAEREAYIRDKFARWGLHASVCAEDVRDLLALLDAAEAEIARLKAELERVQGERNRADASAWREYSAEIKRLRAELGTAKAINASLLYGDDGRAPFSRIDPLGGD